MSFVSTEKFLIMGRSGCGKSYLAKRIQTIYPRRVIIDTVCEYTDRSGAPIYSGAIVVHDFNDFLEELIKLETIKKFELIFQFDVENKLSVEEFDEICRVCYYFGNIQLVVEEVQIHATPHQLPHWLRNLLLSGRHQNVSIMFTSQRPGEINKTIVSQCSQIFCGSLIEGNDLKYVSNFLNQSTKLLTELPDRQFLWRSPKGVKLIHNDF